MYVITCLGKIFLLLYFFFFFFSSRRRHTRWPRDWSSDVCSSDLSTMWPAVRITKASPKPMSKTSSTGTRESEQDSTTTLGSWPVTKETRRVWSILGCSARSSTKRWLPSFKEFQTFCGFMLVICYVTGTDLTRSEYNIHDHD